MQEDSQHLFQDQSLSEMEKGVLDTKVQLEASLQVWKFSCDSSVMFFWLIICVVVLVVGFLLVLISLYLPLSPFFWASVSILAVPMCCLICFIIFLSSSIFFNGILAYLLDKFFTLLTCCSYPFRYFLLYHGCHCFENEDVISNCVMRIRNGFQMKTQLIERKKRRDYSYHKHFNQLLTPRSCTNYCTILIES